MLRGDAPIRVRMEDISKSFGAIKSLDRVNLTIRAPARCSASSATTAPASRR